MGVVHAKGLNTSRDIDLAEVPAKVQKVYIDGIDRTKKDVLAMYVAELLTATNFEDMVKEAQRAKMKMEKLGLFKEVSIDIDVSKGAHARSDGYQVTYKVKEPRRVAGGVSTLVGTNEGSVLFQLRMPSTFGRGERLTGEYTYGTKQAVGFHLNYNKPFLRNPDIVLKTGVHKFSSEESWSNYKGTDRGVHVDLNFPSFLGSHSLMWQGVWRELSCLSNTAAFAVREQAGHSVKSAVKHTWVRDKRDDSVLPTEGYCLQYSQEFAGLAGDTHFIKHETELQYNQPLPLDSTLQLSLAGGMIRSLYPGQDLKIFDRFFLGGPLTLRGFNIRGVGPHEEGSSLGADTYWASGLHLYTPLPFRPGKGGFGELFRTHFFVNAGNLSNLDPNETTTEKFKKLAETLRLAYGAGVVLKLGGVARLELNYVVPVKAQPGDSVNHGIQFGIGLKFI